MKAVILAGGKGERLKPLTNNMPKPMVPIINVPILEYIVKWLKKFNITEIAFTLGYMAKDIISYFGDGRDFGVHIENFIEDEPLGTAGSVKNAESFLDDDFLVVSGDAFCDLDLDELVKYHKEKEKLATIVVKEVPNPQQFGVVAVNDYGIISEFQEKPLHPKSNLVNLGIYIFEKEIVELIPKENYDFAKNLFPRILGEIAAFKTDAYWNDIGTLEGYYNTNSYVARNFAKYQSFFV